MKEQERALAEQLIKSLAAPFQPEKYHDTYQEALQEMIAAKAKGMEVTTAPHVARAPVIDLMQALKNSLAAKTGPQAEKKTLLRTVPKQAAETKKTKSKAS